MNAIIYDIIRVAEKSYKAHYRVYNEDRDLLTEGDYIYTIEKPRRMPPAVLRSKIVTGIYQRILRHGIIKASDRYRSECLTAKDILKIEMEDFVKPKKTSPVVQTFAKKVEVEDDPRIYQVVYMNGLYTIVKASAPYLTREQAKDLLFEKQLESK